MTYDKVAGEGPYIHEHGHTCEYKCLACTYAEGRKAERERCARIADGLLNLEVGDLVGTSIATKIRGGQDGE